MDHKVMMNNLRKKVNFAEKKWFETKEHKRMIQLNIECMKLDKLDNTNKEERKKLRENAEEERSKVYNSDEYCIWLTLLVTLATFNSLKFTTAHKDMLSVSARL